MSIINVNSDNFDSEVLQSDLPVLLDFWAPWCGYCTPMEPSLKELAEELKGKAKIAKLNVDEAGELAQAYRVSGIPALKVFKDGKVVNEAVGLQSKANLKNLLGL